MSDRLKGRKLAIIGTGYLGNRIASLAATHGCHVFCVNRSGRGTRPFLPELASKIEFIQGNAMKPEGFQDVLQASDSVVFCIGTLIDSSVTKGAKPGDEGTYEHMNRDCAIAVGNQIERLKDKTKKMVFVSASRAPPFLPRYLTCKIEAEEHLMRLPSLRTTIVRPGFIYDGKERPVSIPIKMGIDAHSLVFGKLLDLIPDGSAAKKVLRNFEAGESVSLQEVADSCLLGAMNSKFDGKILTNNDMKLLSEKLRKNGFKFDQF